MSTRRPKSSGGEAGRSLAARRLAQTVLDDVLDKKQPLDRALDDRLAKAAGGDMAGRDRAFARTIATTTIRRLGQVDDAIRRFTKKGKLPSRSRAALDILRAGVTELIFLNVPPHAALDSANRLTSRHTVARHFRPLINAVLRQITENKSSLADQDAYELNIPPWLRKRWEHSYGADAARAIGNACLTPPPLDLTVKSSNQAEAWAGKLEAALLPTESLRLHDAGQVDRLAGFADGAWWAQDAAAALPARLFGNDLAGQTVIDLCAAPGGKTAQLAAAGAQVIAVDRSAGRLKRVHENLERLSLATAIVEADAMSWQPPEPAPYVLLDAPCSATGTLRRHPDILRLKSEEDVASAAKLQSSLLDAASRMVAPAGLLVFCTCSLEPEEGEQQVEAFLERNSDFSRSPVTGSDVFGQEEFVTAAGDMRTLPCHWESHGGLDGFYAARLRRSGAA